MIAKRRGGRGDVRRGMEGTAEGPSRPRLSQKTGKINKRIFSKSVDQSYYENPSINPHHISKATNFSPNPTDLRITGNNKDEDYFNETNNINGIKSLISPTHKINRLIKQSLKRNKEHETLKIIEQILKEEHNLIKKEELDKLNKDVRKTNRLREEVRKKKNHKNTKVSK